MAGSVLQSGDDGFTGEFVPCVDGEVAGFFAYERIDALSAGVYASVAVHGYPGLSEAMLLGLMRRLSEEGIRFANLGGSETHSLDLYKAKFPGGSVRRNELFAIDLSGV